MVTPKKKVKVEPAAPTFFMNMSHEAGDVLSKYQKAANKRKVAKGHVPMFLKKQAD